MKPRNTKYETRTSTSTSEIDLEYVLVLEHVLILDLNLEIHVILNIVLDLVFEKSSGFDPTIVVVIRLRLIILGPKKSS